jgi:hypothetical protein
MNRVTAEPWWRALLTPWVGVAIAAVVVAYATLRLPGDTVDSLIGEDRFYETLGAAGLLVAAIAFVLTARRVHGAGAETGASRAKPWILGFVGLFLFLAAGEEISWGQRFLGISTPESIREVNTQGETNLHNIEGIQGKGDLLFQLFWGSLFVLVPLVALASRRVRELAERFFVVAPAGIAVVLIVNYIASNVASEVLDGSAYTSIYPLTHATTELKEAIVSVTIGVAAILVLRASPRRVPAPTATPAPS